MPKISRIRIVELPQAEISATLDADLDWVKKRGVDVERLHQEMIPFDPLLNSGSLPQVFVDGDLAISGRYPTREEMGIWMMFGFVSPNDRNSSGPRPCTL